MLKPRTSPEQIRANQANSQLSTGPRTELGKASASRNRTKHGFAGGAFFLLEDEDPEEYHDLLASLRTEHKPVTETEDLLVVKLAQHHYLQQRALSYQSQAFAETGKTWHERVLTLYIRYHAQHERAFNKILTQLKEQQKQRRDEEYQVPLSELTMLGSKQAKLKAEAIILEDRADAAHARMKARIRERLDAQQSAATAQISPSPLAESVESRFESQNDHAGKTKAA